MPDSACASFDPHIADAQAPWAGTPYWTLKFTLGLAGSVLAALGPACTLLVRRCGTCTGRGPFALSCALCATRMFQVEAGLHCADTKYQITRCRCACALQEVPPVSTLPVLPPPGFASSMFCARLQTFLGLGSWHSLSRTVGCSLDWVLVSDHRY